jgi:hypothetical protein
MAAKKESLAKKDELTEAKIRQVIWMLKVGKTKKACCEHLGISYNTKRLDSIIEEFNQKIERTKELKATAKNKEFSQNEKIQIAKDYQNGESISAIAERNYISSQKVKSFLLEIGVPIRSRKKNGEAKTDHVTQDLDVKFVKGDRVFYAPENSFAVIDKVFDEDYIEYLRSGNQKYVQLCEFKEDKFGRHGKYSSPALDVHYQIYWILEDGSQWKLESLKHHINHIESMIEEYGRESYGIWVDGEHSYTKLFVPRHQLFPVLTK